jgi:hypothetical protein
MAGPHILIKIVQIKQKRVTEMLWMRRIMKIYTRGSDSRKEKPS